MHELLQTALAELDANRRVVVATVATTSGSTPAKIGAKLLVRSDGTTVGTVGGGCVEGDIWFTAREMFKHDQRFEFGKYTLNEDIAASTGLVCGGTLKVLLEIWDASDKHWIEDLLAASRTTNPLLLATTFVKLNGSLSGTRRIVRHLDELPSSLHKPARDVLAGSGSKLEKIDRSLCFLEAYARPPKIVVAGGGHVGQAIQHIARYLDFATAVIDDREEYANPQRFDGAEIYCGPMQAGFSTLRVGAPDFIVICTRGHRYDLDVCAAALKTDARYIGLLGSKRKAVLVIRELCVQGVAKRQVRRLTSPIGVDIGAVTPEEIAISVMGQVVALLRGTNVAGLELEESLVAKAIAGRRGK